MSFSQWTAAQHSGAAMLLDLALHKRSAEELESAAKMDFSRARHLVWLSRQYLPALLRHATSFELSVDQLDVINKFVKQISTPYDLDALRREFIEQAATMLLRDLRAYMTRRVQEINDTAERPMPAARFNLGRTPDAHGRVHFSGWMPEKHAHTLRNRLQADARSLRAANESLSLLDALGQAAITRLLSQSLHQPTHEPCFLLPLDADTTYFADGKVVTSDGALLNIHDLLNQSISHFGYAIAWGLNEQGHPTPVAAARIQRTELLPNKDPDRFFSPWQKYLAAIEHLTCVHDQCDISAQSCEGHHLKPWASGGPTSYDNLVPLCKYHNRRNDDFPQGLTSKGRIEKDPKTGIPGRRTPDSDALKFRVHIKSAAYWAYTYYRHELE